MELLKKINIKTCFTMLVCMITAGALIGCSSKTKNISAKEVGESIEHAVKIDALKKGDQKKLQKLYDISAEDVEDFVLYTAPTNIKADEVVVLKVKDSKNIESIKKKILERIDSQSKKFKDYLPNENFLIENHILKIKGNYVLLAVSAQADKIEKAFNEALN